MHRGGEPLLEEEDGDEDEDDDELTVPLLPAPEVDGEPLLAWPLLPLEESAPELPPASPEAVPPSLPLQPAANTTDATTTARTLDPGIFSFPFKQRWANPTHTGSFADGAGLGGSAPDGGPHQPCGLPFARPGRDAATAMSSVHNSAGPYATVHTSTTILSARVCYPLAWRSWTCHF